jgi:hypothetical protein
MMKLAADRFDSAAKTLKLTPDRVTAIKPLIQSKCIDMGQVKGVHMVSDKTNASKKQAIQAASITH